MYPRNRSPSDAMMLDAPPLPLPPTGPSPPSHLDAAAMIAVDPLAPYQFPPHAHPAQRYPQGTHGHRPHSGAPSPSSVRFAPYYAAAAISQRAQAAAAFYLDGVIPPAQPPHRGRHHPVGTASPSSNHAHEYFNPHYYAYGAPGAGAFPYPGPPPPPHHPSMDDDCGRITDPYYLDNAQFSMQYPPTAAPSAASFSTSGGGSATFDDYNAPFHAAQSPLNPPALQSNPLAAFLGPIPHPHPRPSDFTAVERPPTPPHFKSAHHHRHRPNGARNGVANAAAGIGAETGSSFTSNSTLSSSSMESTRSSGDMHQGTHHNRGRRHSYPAAALNPTASTYSAPGQQHAAEASDDRYARHHPGTSGPATTAHGHNMAPLALLSVTCPQLAYITNAHGDVISIEGNGSVWDSYVDQSLVHPFMDASPLACYPLILGRNLFDFIVCGKMQALMKHMLIISSNAQRSRLNYHWYSETDTIERKLRITLTRLSALMPNAPTPSTIRFAPRPSSTAAPPTLAAAIAAPPLPVVFSWTVTILSERVKSPAERAIASHLTCPPLPVATPHSRAICLLCKRIQVDRHEISQDAWLDFAGPKRVVSDTHPAYEQDGYTPILGHRGRLGMQIASAVQAGLTVWLTGGQVAAFNASTAAGPEASADEAASPSGSLGAAQATGHRHRHAHHARRPVQAPLCATPVHVGVCEVCRLDVLQFFSPMYTPIGGRAESAAPA